MNAVSVIKTGWLAVKTFGIQNAPIIFTGCAIVGIIGVGVSAWKGATKARKIVNEETEKKGSALSRKEKLKKTWKAWLPPVAIGVASVASMGAAYYISSVRLAEATAVATMLATNNKDLRDEIDALSEKLPDDIRKEVHEGQLEKEVKEELYQINDNLKDSFYNTGTGYLYFLDRMRHLKFQASLEHVSSAISSFAREYKDASEHDMALPINRFYRYLKIPEIGFGNIWGYYATCELMRYADIADDFRITRIQSIVEGDDLYVIDYDPPCRIDSLECYEGPLSVLYDDDFYKYELN